MCDEIQEFLEIDARILSARGELKNKSVSFRDNDNNNNNNNDDRDSNNIDGNQGTNEHLDFSIKTTTSDSESLFSSAKSNKNTYNNNNNSNNNNDDSDDDTDWHDTYYKNNNNDKEIIQSNNNNNNKIIIFEHQLLLSIKRELLQSIPSIVQYTFIIYLLLIIFNFIDITKTTYWRIFVTYCTLVLLFIYIKTILFKIETRNSSN